MASRQNSKKITPMMKQYYDIKNEHEDCLLLFRMGDFYETFDDDAITCSKALGIALAKRQGQDLAGVPYHALDKYLPMLIRKGYKVAICEQVEDPKEKSGKVVKREVTRIITPGTVYENDLLDDKINNYMMSIVLLKKQIGIAIIDFSTGEFLINELKKDDLLSQILNIMHKFNPSECLLPLSLFENKDFYSGLKKEFPDLFITTIDNYYYEFENAYEQLTTHFHTNSLDGFGVEGLQVGIQAAGAIMSYLKNMQKTSLKNIIKISAYQSSKYMNLDVATQKNLEIMQNIVDNGVKGSLLEIFDHTVSPMGARLIRKWLIQPLTVLLEINNRQDAVEELFNDVFKREEIREILAHVFDIERLISKISYGNANGRDLNTLKHSLLKIRELKKINAFKSELLIEAINNIKELPDIIELIEKNIKEDCPITIKEGGIIKKGVHSELDEIREIQRNSKNYLLKMEEEERKKTGIKNLKVKFNKVFGYFIEVTKSNLKEVPERYIRKQTLVNAERFIVPELKDFEAKILSADERIKNIEYEIFVKVRDKVSEKIEEIQEIARSISILDVISTYSEIAKLNNYVKPIVNGSNRIEIIDGRHPVVEKISGPHNFIPNDAYLDSKDNLIIILTGPNMAGKCCNENTIIFSEQGMLPISAFKPEDSKIGEFKELKVKIIGKNGISSTSHFYSNGEKQSIIIKTKMGYSIEGSYNHRVLVRTPNGEEKWKFLPDITKYDYLIINRKNNLWGSELNINFNPPKYKKTPLIYPIPSEMNEDLAYLIGLLIGDGTLTYKNSYNFTNTEDALKKSFYEIIFKLFNYKAKTKGGFEHFVSSLYLRDFLKYLGLDRVQAHEKVVPLSILKAPRHIVRAFLQGLFDTDACADKRYGNVSYSTSSLKMAKQIHMILLNFNIISSLKPKRTKRRINYLVNISGSDAIKFHKEIGFRVPNKKERAKLASPLRMTNVDSIPYLSGLLKVIQKKIVEKSALIPRKDKLKYNKKIGSIFYSYIYRNRNISFNKLSELIDYCRRYEINHQELNILIENNYFYDQIVEIKKGRSILYDFCVPESHTFIGNGIINHNSTFIRQIALITLMAQIGSYVPAQKATIGIVDRIFSRVGAFDDISRQRSTFMVEMNETANIINNATKKSLIILDELGRGTSTFDGLSIAWSVIEHIHNETRAKTLFATHYHQLCEIENYLSGVKNYHIQIREQGSEMIFLRKIKRGGSDKSFGIEVARLAGIPQPIIKRAQKILKKLEDGDPVQDPEHKKIPIQKIKPVKESKDKKSKRVIQKSLFD